MDRKTLTDERPIERRDVIDDRGLLGVLMWLFILVQIAWALRPVTIC